MRMPCVCREKLLTRRRLPVPETKKQTSGKTNDKNSGGSSRQGENKSGAKKSKVTVRDRGSNHKEISAIIVLAVCVFFVVSMFGKAGIVGNFIVKIFYGFFGGFGTIVVVLTAVAVGISILRGTEKSTFRVRKCLLLVLLLLCSSALLHTASNVYDHYTSGQHGFIPFISSLWNSVDTHFLGGGLIGGAFSSLLQSTVAKVGTYVILIPATFVLAMILFSFSISPLVSKIENLTKRGISGIAAIKERFREEKEEQQQEEAAAAAKRRKSAYTAENDIVFSGQHAPEEASEEDPFLLEPDPHENEPEALPVPEIDMEPILLPDMTEPQPAASSQPVYGEADDETLLSFDEEDVTEEIDDVVKLKRPVTQDIPVLSEGKYANYIYPPDNLLNADISARPSPVAERAAATAVARKLEDVLRSFSIEAKVTHVSMGPSVTRYELLPSTGVRVNKIKNLSDDIALNLAAQSIRIEAPIPGKAAIGIEIPNREIRTVYLREIIESAEFKNSKSKLTFSLGRDISNVPVSVDLEKMPHLLIAGTTGSGKSVCTNCLIISLLYKASPDEVRLILIDPKIVEFSKYNGIPHLLLPVVTEPKKAAAALAWSVAEMEKRYKLFAEHGVRDISSYNTYAEKNGYNKMPSIVILIDELADLMMVARDSVETAINRIAQKARAAGMHLVIATQRPSVDVITGLIKSNVPSRIALKVAGAVDSRIIIDSTGAEKLLGRGDMLFNPVGSMKATRIQGAFVSDEEVERLVDFIKDNGEEAYIEEIIDSVNAASEKTDSLLSLGSDSDDEEDSVFKEAVRIALEDKQISASYLQRRLKIGFNRAARIIDEMEEKGIISCRDGNNPRKVLIDHYEG